AGPAEYRWEFGDGASARGIEARHRYTGPGLYRVVLTVQDRSGNAASAERTIRIVPPELVADFTWSPEEPTVLDEVRFRDLSRGEIEKWNWDFGDGATSDIPNPTHSYKEKGTFTVTLTVTDRYGNSAAASKELRVVNIPPTADPGGPYEGFIYQEIVFSAERSSDPDGEIVSYLWDFGDGNEARGRQVLHVYLKPGTYTVCLTVIDDDGDADTACTTAEIAVYYQTPEGGSP
ncbi:PKD domain-containing protein, partial [Candidatus Bipolaricaulota bacterium]|nr:PKD domain-containing protein [Candidatus Bipolaricaulota bacterium]